MSEGDAGTRWIRPRGRRPSEGKEQASQHLDAAAMRAGLLGLGLDQESWPTAAKAESTLRTHE